MPLPSSIPGATFKNAPVLSDRRTKLATKTFSQQIFQAGNTLAPGMSDRTSFGADTVFAGTPSLLISMGGVDTLRAAHDVLEFRTPPRASHAAAENTPMGGANISFAAAGNLTLLGGSDVTLPMPDPLRTDMGGLTTVFGAAMSGGFMDLVRDQPAGATHGTAGGMVDLLLDWSLPPSGTVLEFRGREAGVAPPTGPANHATLGDGTNIHLSSPSRDGIMELLFSKPS